MTNRINTLTVALEKEYREDDLQHIIDAIRMIKGVLEVTYGAVDSSTYGARMQLKAEFCKKLWKLVDEI